MKLFRKWLLGVVMLGVLAAVAPPRAGALVMIGGKGFIGDAGWPDGALAMANLDTRIEFWDGPAAGFMRFVYQCKNTEQFNDALAVFAGILTPRLELVVLDGKYAGFPAKEERIDWIFEIWVPESFYRAWGTQRNYTTSGSPDDFQPVPPPRVTLYLNGGNPIAWEKVKVPRKVTVIDKRVEAAAFKDAKGGALRAVVREMNTGKVIHGAAVTLLQYSPESYWRDLVSTRTLTTDATGEAAARDLPNGDYKVLAGAEGFVAREGGYFKCLGRNLESFDIALAKPATLKGTVRDARGKPLAGVTVETRELVGIDGLSYRNASRSARSDALGRFEIAGLPEGFMELRADKAGYYYFSREVHEVGSFKFHVPPHKEIELVMGPAGAIWGNVKGMEKAEKEKAQVLVKLDPVGDPIGKWGGSMNVNWDGTFEFKGVPAGKYVLHAALNPTTEKREEAQTRVTIDYSGEGSRRVDLELK